MHSSKRRQRLQIKATPLRKCVNCKGNHNARFKEHRRLRKLETSTIEFRKKWKNLDILNPIHGGISATALHKTFLKPKTNLKLPGYGVLRRVRLDRHRGGLALLISKELKVINQDSLKVQSSKLGLSSMHFGHVNWC